MSLKFKTLIFLSFILLYTLSVAAKEKKVKSNDAIFGTRNEREVHLGTFTVQEKFKRLRRIEKEFVYRPKPEEPNYKRIITRIVVADQYKNGKGGKATLKDGGPGNNFALLKLKSKRGHGYHFIIDIYGI